MNRLTETQCKNAKPDAGRRITKLVDGAGLYLAIKDNGSKLWRMKFRHGGVEKVYSIGAWPDISLAAARVERDKAKALLRDGSNPTLQRDLLKRQQTQPQDVTFKTVAEAWFADQVHWSDSHRAAQRLRLNRDILPQLGRWPIAQIKAQMVTAALNSIKDRGVHETARKCLQIIGQIFRYGMAQGHCENDPAHALEVKVPNAKNRATVNWDELPGLFEALGETDAEVNTRLGLLWVTLTACRTHEMRGATWSEIEEGNMWRIPAERMKMRDPHMVPLSKQAQDVLREAAKLRRSDRGDALVFPGFSRHGGLSENALLSMLARAGFHKRQTAHGLRACFSTYAHEKLGADPLWIEACLSHTKEGVAGVYNRSLYLPQRRKTLQKWADYLTQCGMRVPAIVTA